MAKSVNSHSLDKESHIQGIINACADGILIVGKDNSIRAYNQSLIDFTGLTSLPDVLHELNFATALGPYLHDSDVPTEYRKAGVLHRLNGELVEVFCRPLIEEGELSGYVWTVRNPANHDETTAALVEREETWRTITELMPQLVFICREDGLNIYFNQKWVDYTGLSLEESRGHGWAKAFHEDDQRAGSHAKRDAVSYETESRIRRTDGEYRWFLIRGYPVLAPNGDVSRWIGTCTDIHDMKLAEVALKASQDDLEKRVEERTEELTKAILQADRANAAKSEFLSRTSHELRTPLNAILGFGQILELSDLSDDDRDSAAIIVKSGRYLLNLINEVLDIASIEGCELPLSIEPVSLADVLSDCGSLIQPLASQRSIDVQINIGEAGKILVLADQQRLKQVLLNLLSNGIKYNNIGGVLKVSTTTSVDKRVNIIVSDTGSGISESDLEKLFNPFERLNAANTDCEGSGLGLVLARHLTNAMSGTLEVSSKLGVGTVFTVSLPLAEYEHVTQGRLCDEGSSHQTELNQEKVYKVLYIEDNSSNTRLVEAVFRRQPGFRLWTATEGVAGCGVAASLLPDLVLLDLDLPDIPGTEVLRRLRADSTTAHIPVIVVSADASAKRIERLMAEGAAAYVTKPINIASFVDTVYQFTHQMAS